MASAQGEDSRLLAGTGPTQSGELVLAEGKAMAGSSAQLCTLAELVVGWTSELKIN